MDKNRQQKKEAHKIKHSPKWHTKAAEEGGGGGR